MRAVTSATAASVLQIDRKSFDNLLLRIGPAAVPPGRQGVERRIPVSLVEELLLAADLNIALGVPAKVAFRIAQQLLGRSTEGTRGNTAEFLGSLNIGAFVQLGADVALLRAEMQRRYEVAVETVVRQARGRPSKRR